MVWIMFSVFSETYFIVRPEKWSDCLRCFKTVSFIHVWQKPTNSFQSQSSAPAPPRLSVDAAVWFHLNNFRNTEYRMKLLLRLPGSGAYVLWSCWAVPLWPSLHLPFPGLVNDAVIDHESFSFPSQQDLCSFLKNRGLLWAAASPLMLRTAEGGSRLNCGPDPPNPI